MNNTLTINFTQYLHLNFLYKNLMKSEDESVNLIENTTKTDEKDRVVNLARP